MSIIGKTFTHTCERAWTDETGTIRIEGREVRCRITEANEYTVSFEVLELLGVTNENPRGSTPTTGGMTRDLLASITDI